MKGYEINFRSCKTYAELYERIIKGMDFPQWCGKNPDSIWDMLSSDIKVPAIIYLEGVNEIPNELSEHKDIILKIFDRARVWYKELGETVEVKMLK